MKDSVDGLLNEIKRATEKHGLAGVRIIEKTKSILKVRVHLLEDVYIQIYANIKKPKRSYTLVFNDQRLFGKDLVFGQWHLHPFENPEKHDVSEKGKEPITIDDFFTESILIVSERLRII